MFETKSKMLTRLAVYSLSSAFLASCGGDDIGGGISDPPEAEWQLVWEDNFDGDSINMDKWDLEHNCWGGGNNEQQCYTERTGDDANAFVEGGMLNIVARAESFTGPNVSDDDPSYPGADATQDYTSARLRTRDLADWRYGRFEIRAKMPAGQGLWTGIWMLPSESPYGDWPMSGELDIVETVNLGADGGLDGAAEDRVFGTTHYGRPWPGQQQTGASYQLPDGSNPADDFHTYAVEYEYGEIRWYVDGVHYQTQVQEGSWWSQLPAQVLNEDGDLEDGFINAPEGAPFDGEENFYMLLNLAVGGDWAANVNEMGVDPDVFPATMQVDYVRVYRCKGSSTYTRAGCGTGPNIGNAGETLVEASVKRPSLTAASMAPLPLYTLYDNALASELKFNSYNPAGLVEWNEITDEDAAHGKVFNLVKSGAGDGNAYFEITGGAANLSHWVDDANGSLVFDMKINAIDAGTNLLIKLDSGWPNVSDMAMDIPPTGEWTTVVLDIQELLDAGNSISGNGETADISAITNMFVMEPSGGMIDVSFDNVRFTQTLPSITVFDDAVTDWDLGFYSSGGADVVMEVVVDPVDPDGHGNVIQITYADSENVSYLQSTTSSDFSTYANGTVEFDMYVVTQPAGAWQMKFEGGTGGSNTTGDTPLTASVEGLAPVTGEWQHFTFTLADLADRGVDLSSINTPLVIFPAWLEQTGAMFRIDNVVINPGS